MCSTSSTTLLDVNGSLLEIFSIVFHSQTEEQIHSYYLYFFFFLYFKICTERQINSIILWINVSRKGMNATRHWFSTSQISAINPHSSEFGRGKREKQ